MRSISILIFYLPDTELIEAVIETTGFFSAIV